MALASQLFERFSLRFLVCTVEGPPHPAPFAASELHQLAVPSIIHDVEIADVHRVLVTQHDADPARFFLCKSNLALPKPLTSHSRSRQRDSLAYCEWSSNISSPVCASTTQHAVGFCQETRPFDHCLSRRRRNMGRTLHDLNLWNILHDQLFRHTNHHDLPLAQRYKHMHVSSTETRWTPAQRARNHARTARCQSHRSPRKQRLSINFNFCSLQRRNRRLPTFQLSAASATRQRLGS